MSKQVFPRWLPLQVARFYEFPLALTGKGQSVAIISLGGKTDPEDIRTDLIRSRTPVPQLDFIDVDPENMTEQQNQQFTGETHLDVEVLASFCPQAHITVLRGSWNGGFAAALHAAIDRKIPVISISWGYPEYTNQDFMSIEKALIRARHEGITVCASSGDAGSSTTFSKPAEVGPAEDQGAHVIYPASSPNVVACGGTELHVENEHYREVVWNNIALKKGATGGGVSKLFEKPEWQKDHDMPHANTGAEGRILPDVAGLAASRDWEIFMEGNSRPAGGTSAVAPLWAGLFVMVNEVRASQGKEPIGFVNPLLYALAKQHKPFTDITEGNNRFHSQYPGYDAREGYDACTGWGSPRAKSLIELLADS